MKYILSNKLLITSILIGLLSGCASDYPCGEPGVGKCMSVTQNYDSSFNDHTNPEDVAPKGMFGGSGDDSSSSSDNNKKAVPFKFTNYNQVPSDGSPLISQPTMIRVWLTPYTDTDNIYHEQQYEYIITDKGHWLYGNNKFDGKDNLQSIKLIQGSANNTNLGNYGNPPKKSQNNAASTNPASVLSDYPALNALKNQSVPVTTTTVGSGIDRTTMIQQ